MSNIVITQLGNCLVSAGYEDSKPVWFECRKDSDGPLVGNVYVGKVITVVKNIQAAFIQIAPGLNCYYSLKDNPEPFYVKRLGKKELVQGDEILVQVEKEALKTKDPVVTSNINLPGKYMALTTGNQKLGISHKLSEKKRNELKEIFQNFDLKGNGVVVRTNAATATLEELEEELKQLMEALTHILDTAQYRTAFSLLYKAEDFYIQQLRNLPAGTLEKVVTDNKDIYEEIKAYFGKYQPEAMEKLQFYEDTTMPLGALYNLSRDLERALIKNVWMKSGAYLVIEVTEACTVIDVNTGKYDGKNKDKQKTFLKINLEAAKEAANQIRLRNLSGMILVDFIDLEKEEDKAYLMQEFHNYLKKDSVPVTLVDLTKLQLAELTRKKVKKPLHEQITLNDLRGV